MADETQMVAASADSENETPVDAGQSQDSEQATSAADVSGAKTDKAPKTKESRVNLFELDEFKEYQSAYTRQIEQQRQEAIKQRQEREKIAKELEEIKLKGMNEFDQIRYRLQKEQQEKQRLAEQLEYIRLAQQYEEDIRRIVDDTGIPRKQLEAAQNIIEAEELGRKWMKKSLEEQVQARVDAALAAQKANAPDLGGGKTATPLSESEEALQNAWDSRNATGVVLEILNSRLNSR